MDLSLTPQHQLMCTLFGHERDARLSKSTLRCNWNTHLTSIVSDSYGCKLLLN